jgi:hypothetical protein
MRLFAATIIILGFMSTAFAASPSVRTSSKNLFGHCEGVAEAYGAIKVRFQSGAFGGVRMINKPLVHELIRDLDITDIGGDATSLSTSDYISKCDLGSGDDVPFLGCVNYGAFLMGFFVDGLGGTRGSFDFEFAKFEMTRHEADHSLYDMVLQVNDFKRTLVLSDVTCEFD